MDDLIKAEIRLITKDGHPGDWQWMGKLSKESLRLLTQIADLMSDNDVEKAAKEG